MSREFRTKKAGLAAVAGIAFAALAHSQESPIVLERSRIVKLDSAIAWSNSVAIVRAAPVIVNVMDPASKLIGFTMPLSAEDVKKLLLDAKEIERQPHTLHVTLWVSSTPQGTRLFVRAAPNGAGFFSHSTGQIEKQILDAVEKGATWRTTADDPSNFRTYQAPMRAAFSGASQAIRASPRARLNLDNPDPAVLTCSLMIPSAELKSFAKGVVNQIYPGAAHLTLWFDPAQDGTSVRSRSLIFESGSLTPVPLPSLGRLESAIHGAIEERLNGSQDAAIGIGSDYKGKPGFWTSLFGFHALSSKQEAAATLVRELPTPIERAWQAALQVITQSQVIAESDGKTGALSFISAHSSQTGTRYAVHRVALRLEPTGFGSRLTIAIPDTMETAEESDRELKALAERIGTELFLKERLTWLTGKEGAK